MLLFLLATRNISSLWKVICLQPSPAECAGQAIKTPFLFPFFEQAFPLSFRPCSLLEPYIILHPYEPKMPLLIFTSYSSSPTLSNPSGSSIWITLASLSIFLIIASWSGIKNSLSSLITKAISCCGYSSMRSTTPTSP